MISDKEFVMLKEKLEEYVNINTRDTIGTRLTMFGIDYGSYIQGNRGLVVKLATIPAHQSFIHNGVALCGRYKKK